MRSATFLALCALAVGPAPILHAAPSYLFSWTVPTQVPRALGVGPDGHVFLASNWPPQVDEFDALGGHLRTLELGGPFFGSPEDVAADAAGILYVVDETRRLRRFTSAGAELPSWDVAYGCDGVQVCVAGDGSVYVMCYCEGSTQSLHRYDPDGTLLGSWEVPYFGAPAGGYQPRGLAVAGDGRVAVAFGDRVVLLRPDGSLLRSIGDPTGGSGAGEFRGAMGLAFDRDGSLLACDLGNDRVQRFDRRGLFLSAWLGPSIQPFSMPMDVVVAANGMVYVLSYGVKQVEAFEGEPVPVRPTSWGKLKARYR